MTWEETIKYIRNRPEFHDLVKLSYLEENLSSNVERFKFSEEFTEILGIIALYVPEARSIADLGAGNGVASVNFALKGFNVLAVEPDQSDTVGSGAIAVQMEKFKLDNLKILSTPAESIPIEDESYDIVFVRQALHHASDLHKFVSEGARILRRGGLFLGIREHVIYNEEDKMFFLDCHPLQKYYGGENAYTADQYLNAFDKAGLSIVKTLKYFDSVINYYPLKFEDFELEHLLRKKIGFLSKVKLLQKLYHLQLEMRFGKHPDETKIPGRMYSFIAIKPNIT